MLVLSYSLYAPCTTGRPANREELFNLHHSSLRNVIEHIFGVLKWRFQILLIAPEYNLEVQAQIPIALSAIHNFICIHDLLEGSLPNDNYTHDSFGGPGSDLEQIPVSEEG
jgi:hypothetical protein